MAVYFLPVLLSVWLWKPAFGIQVTPNSGCASICMDYSQEIVICHDSDFSATVSGLKFQNCISCLQSSSATTATQSDQAIFLSSLRYTLDTCIFMAENVSQQANPACSPRATCSQLKEALEINAQSPSQSDEYSYCTADGSSLGMTDLYLGTCQKCLQQDSGLFYLSNFLVALNAGCKQQPVNGTVLGLQGSLFSQSQVQIINVGGTKVAAATDNRKGLSQAALAGVAVGVAVVLSIIAFSIYLCVRRYRKAETKKLKTFQCPLNPRFGASNISAPIMGAYMSSEISQTRTTPAYKGPKFPPPPTQPKRGLKIPSLPVQKSPLVRNFSMKGQNEKQKGMWAGTPETISKAQPSIRAIYPPQRSQQDYYTAQNSYVPPLPPIKERYLGKRQSNPATTQASTTNLPTPSLSQYHNSPPITPHLPSPRSFTTTISSSGSTIGALDDIIIVHSPDFAPDNQLSPPMSSISTRFDFQDDGRQARERLYNDGVSKTSAWKFGSQSGERSPTEIESPRSASTAVSQEIWLSRY